MPKGCFITGTDTGVGKTVFTAALATILRMSGFKVGVMKPVETGCPTKEGKHLPQDALFLRTISHSTAPLELIVPYTFTEPVAPAIAAEQTNTYIDIKTICDCYQKLQEEHDIVLVEGAGGLLVPLNAQLSMQDIAVELHLPMFIVARNILGTINHTALTVEIARQRSRVLGVILNCPEALDPLDPAIQTNEQALKRWVRAPFCAQLPYKSSLSEEALLSLGRLFITDQLLEAMEIGPSSKTPLINQFNKMEHRDDFTEDSLSSFRR